LIVIACNSASAAALHHLRDVLPEIPFVGMEPAVKPAAEQTTTGVVAVLATGATFQGELFRSLVGTHASDVEIIEQACPGLAAAIESGDDSSDLLDTYLAPIAASDADVVVLGCTHYPLIRAEIADRLGAHVALIDPAPAVAARVSDIAHQHAVVVQGAGSTRMWSTGATVPSDGRDWEPIDIPTDARSAMRAGETSLVAVRADLTSLGLDAIVNAANVELRHGGGIARAIALAGGQAIDEESAAWIDQYGPLEPGVAALTSAGHMPSSYVIHVAGPIHCEGQDNETLLAAAVFAALDMGTEIGVHSIGFPAVSAGIYGYPKDEATAVIAESAAEYLDATDTTIRSVWLVGFDDAMAGRFAVAIRGLVTQA
jgi:O-acetyl-ADP-ribose deacetylase (regulator of RNase III)